MANAIRRMYVRNQVLRVLDQTRTVWLLEETLMSQVNLTMEPAVSPKEITVALQELKDKGMVDYRVDPLDAEIKRWQITEIGKAQVK